MSTRECGATGSSAPAKIRCTTWPQGSAGWTIFAESDRKDARTIHGLPVGGSVLEIGAGIGRLLVEMEDRFDELVGVDISPRVIELSHDYVAGHAKVELLLNDGSILPFENERFDVVFSYIAFQHIPDRALVEKHIRESYRVLRPGGAFRFQVIHRSPRQTLLRPIGLAQTDHVAGIQLDKEDPGSSDDGVTVRSGPG